MCAQRATKEQHKLTVAMCAQRAIKEQHKLTVAMCAGLIEALLDQLLMMGTILAVAWDQVT